MGFIIGTGTGTARRSLVAFHVSFCHKRFSHHG